MRSTTPSCYEKPQKKTRKAMLDVNNGADGAISAVLSEVDFRIKRITLKQSSRLFSDEVNVKISLQHDTIRYDTIRYDFLVSWLGHFYHTTQLLHETPPTHTILRH